MRTVWLRRFWLAQAQWMEHWKWLLAGVSCGMAAAILAWIFRNSASRALLPLVCLVFVVIVAMRFGARSGIVGSILATIVFCFVLFPVGALRIDDVAERTNVVWMLLGGVSLSYLLSSDDSDDKDGLS